MLAAKGNDNMHHSHDDDLCISDFAQATFKVDVRNIIEERRFKCNSTNIYKVKKTASKDLNRKFRQILLRKTRRR